MNRLALFFVIFLLTGGALTMTTGRPPVSNAAAKMANDQPCPVSDRRGLEEMILRSTVRMHLRTWRMAPDESGYFLDETIGHATLRDGRFLVTHNHYAPLEQEEGQAGPISVILFDSAGRHLFSSPLSNFDIRQVGEETLVFELKYDADAERLFAAGIIAADFADWRSLPLEEGQVVAQVDWDGERSRVDWAPIARIEASSSVPRLVLDDGVLKGGSGGGVFWNGMHIANNWQSIEQLSDAGEWYAVTGVAALDDFR